MMMYRIANAPKPEGPFLRRAWAYWTTLEWLGWSFYRRHLKTGNREKWKIDRLAPLRVMLILSSIATACVLWWPNEMFEDAAGYHYIRAIIHEDVLGSLFALHAVGLAWRLFAVRSCYPWTAVFGAIGILLYFGVPVAVFLDLGRLTIAGISMMSLGAGCWWLVARGPQQREVD